ncbi:MAG: ABC transporter substrate-binding protein [Aquitalea sp.]|nr:ABC transporter substrate-binding protein [Aquitalea sp.]
MRSVLLLCCCLLMAPAWAAPVTLRAGVMVENAGPYNFTPDSPMAGIYREALEQIGKLSGLRFEIEYYPAQRIQQLFEVARLDVEVGVNPAWRSLSPVGGFYTLPIGTLEYQLCVRGGSGRSAKSLEEMQGQVLGLLQGQPLTVFEADFSRHGMHYEISQSESEALNKLKLGRLQAVVLERRQVERLMLVPEELRCEPGGLISTQAVMLRLHPQYRQWLPALNRAIAQLQANGKLKAIFQKNRG